MILTSAPMNKEESSAIQNIERLMGNSPQQRLVTASPHPLGNLSTSCTEILNQNVKYEEYKIVNTVKYSITSMTPL